MKKLRLEIDDLRVETFSTAADRERETGTVRANDSAESYDRRFCYTAPDFDMTCFGDVYTCPECASPPETSFGCGDPEPTFPC